MTEGLEFTNNWFDITAAPNWNALLKRYSPDKILEIGSFEGRSACSLIEMLDIEESYGDFVVIPPIKPNEIEIHCVDTWEGGQEHSGINMNEVESLFHQNIKKAIDGSKRPVNLHVHKGKSDIELAKLFLSDFEEYFDFIYIDGSHMASDVLSDAVLSFKLLKPGGVLAFDDFAWREEMGKGSNPLTSPKIAIDSFVAIHWDKIEQILTTVSQCWIRKL